MTKTLILGLGLACLVANASQAAAGQTTGGDIEMATDRSQAAKPELLGVDLDNGDVYYDGRNTGRYCFYRTVDVFDRRTGYIEPRRVRRCGRGIYVR